MVRYTYLRPRVFISKGRDTRPHGGCARRRRNAQRRRRRLKHGRLSRLQFMKRRPVNNSPRGTINCRDNRRACPRVTPRGQAASRYPTYSRRLRNISGRALKVCDRASNIICRHGKSGHRCRDRPRRRRTSVPCVVIRNVCRIFLVRRFLSVNVLFGRFLCFNSTIQVNVIKVRLSFSKNDREVMTRRLLQIHARHLDLLTRYLLLKGMFHLLRGDLLIRPLLGLRSITLLRIIASGRKRASILLSMRKGVVDHRRGRCGRPRRRWRRHHASTKHGRLRIGVKCQIVLYFRCVGCGLQIADCGLYGSITVGRWSLVPFLALSS